MDCVVDETTLGIVVDVPGALTAMVLLDRGAGQLVISDPTAPERFLRGQILAVDGDCYNRVDTGAAGEGAAPPLVINLIGQQIRFGGLRLDACQRGGSARISVA
jgi:hypothetical protein